MGRASPREVPTVGPSTQLGHQTEKGTVMTTKTTHGANDSGEYVFIRSADFGTYWDMFVQHEDISGQIILTLWDAKTQAQSNVALPWQDIMAIGVTLIAEAEKSRQVHEEWQRENAAALGK